MTNHAIPLERLARTVLLRPSLRRPEFQPVWSRLHRLALWGMNAGPGGSLTESGEAWVIRQCARQVPAGEPFVLFDGGANDGSYALDAIHIAGRHASVHCFEPSPVSYRKLTATFAAHPQVKTLNFGLSNQERTATLFSHPGGAKEASLVKRDIGHWGLEQTQSETVRLRRLDDYCREAGVERIDLLKMDIEGHELPALEGAGNLLAEKRIRNIQFEFGSPDIESRTFFKDLFQLLNQHYSLYRIVYQGLAPIQAYSEFHENFVTTNFLAVARP